MYHANCNLHVKFSDNSYCCYDDNLNYWGMQPVAHVSIKYLKSVGTYRHKHQRTYNEYCTVQQDRDIISSNFLNTDLNILAVYATTCFILTVTTAFALLYISQKEGDH
jgi:hypothetical protein